MGLKKTPCWLKLFMWNPIPSSVAKSTSPKEIEGLEVGLLVSLNKPSNKSKKQVVNCEFFPSKVNGEFFRSKLAAKANSV